MIYMKWEVYPHVFGDIKEQLLHNRGILTEQEREHFLLPKVADYESCFVLDNLEDAQNRIRDAISKNQKIMIYGDYDVDGICSSAIVYRALKSLGADVKPFMPHRMDHGYGLSKLGLEDLKKTNPVVDLLITVDNGIVAYEGLEYAKKLGIEVIVSDHHEKGDKSVLAMAVVHTTEMCGSGVAWTLIRDLVSSEVAANLLQLVAVGTIADVMPMVGVNRALVVEGITQLKRNPNLGLKTLAKHLGLTIKDLSAEKISFELIPKMNAAGRLDSAMPALRMLCFEDAWKVEEYAEMLIKLNDERRLQTKQAIDEALEQLNQSVAVNVVSGNWHPGIVGLVASRLSEVSGKPTLAIAVNNGDSRGSARSVKGVNITELLRTRRELFVDLGGHGGAAGFSLGREMINPLREWLSSIELEGGSELVLAVDAIVSPQQITENFIKEIEGLAPFGAGNPKPVLGSISVKIRDAKRIGDGNHLKLSVDGVDAVGFGMGDRSDQIQSAIGSGKAINLAYKVEMNEFMNRRIPQMKLVDIVIE